MGYYDWEGGRGGNTLAMYARPDFGRFFFFQGGSRRTKRCETDGKHGRHYWLLAIQLGVKGGERAKSTGIMKHSILQQKREHRVTVY